jgi:DNA-directed RNA polymerase I, II, and III subunit RPABC2
MAELQEVEDLPINDIEESDDDMNSLRSSLYGDSDDEDFVPPPPPPRDEEVLGEKSDDEESVQDTEDEHSLASESEPMENEQMDVYMGENEENDYDEDEDDSDDDDENYLQKFDQINKKNLIHNYHPELVTHNNDEVESLCQVVRNEHGVIVDPLHRTVPFLTKYERARILGERAKQLNMGAKPLVELGPEVIDGYLIALKEFEEKKIPFIVKRPMPNGGCEYWKFKDLEFL